MSGATIEIDTDLCDNTQNCHAVCPEDVFEIQDGRVVIVRASDCTACFKCVEVCPAGAVTVDY